MNKTEILGVKVNSVSYLETIELIGNFLKSGKQHQIVTVNPEFVVAAQSNPEFKKILNEASLSLPDGVGLLLASKLQGKRLNTRVTGIDLVEMLAKKGAAAGWSFFFLGGRGTGEKAARELKTRYPHLIIKGTFEGDGEESGDQETVAAVKKSGKVDILLVAYGQVKQEKWIKRNLGKTDVHVAIGVGGAFDFLSGHTSRAPRILRQVGLEWFYRLFRDPKRINRQLALPKFVFLVVKDRFKSPKI